MAVARLQAARECRVNLSSARQTGLRGMGEQELCLHAAAGRREGLTYCLALLFAGGRIVAASAADERGDDGGQFTGVDGLGEVDLKASQKGAASVFGAGKRR